MTKPSIKDRVLGYYSPIRGYVMIGYFVLGIMAFAKLRWWGFAVVTPLAFALAGLKLWLYWDQLGPGIEAVVDIMKARQGK